MGFELTGDEASAMDRMDEAKRVLRLAPFALRTCLDRQLPGARNILGGRAPTECDPSGAPPLRPECLEPDTTTAQFYVADLTRKDIHDAYARVAFTGRPGDAEDE